MSSNLLGVNTQDPLIRSGVKVIFLSAGLGNLRIVNKGGFLRFVVVGDRGMFGAEMFRVLTSRGFDVTGLNRGSIQLGDSVEDLMAKLETFDIIINAVAYTAVDESEINSELANLVNGEYSGKLAEVAGRIGARFLHVSTDYVFDGDSNIPYLPDAEPNPQNAYGKSKLLGEKLIESSGADYTIFRTSWLYGIHGECFPKKVHMKKLLGEPIKVVVDQFGQPTWTRDLATQMLEFCQLQNPPSIIHAVSSGTTNWFEFAKEVVGDYPVEPVLSTAFASLAKRPAFSVLDNSSSLVQPIGDWRDRWRVAKEFVLGP